MYLIGIHKPNSPINVDALMDLIANQATIEGAFMGSTNIKHDIPMYADLYLQGRFNLDDLISREININETLRPPLRSRISKPGILSVIFLRRSSVAKRFLLSNRAIWGRWFH